MLRAFSKQDLIGWSDFYSLLSQLGFNRTAVIFVLRDHALTSPQYSLSLAGLGVAELVGGRPSYDSELAASVNRRFFFLLSRSSNIDSTWAGQRKALRSSSYGPRGHPLT